MTDMVDIKAGDPLEASFEAFEAVGTAEEAAEARKAARPMLGDPAAAQLMAPAAPHWVMPAEQTPGMPVSQTSPAPGQRTAPLRTLNCQMPGMLTFDSAHRCAAMPAMREPMIST